MEIKAQLSIRNVLDHYGLKADKNGKMNCPFHDDKTPSMQVYEASNTYCCFSSNCEAGTGDQIQFIELMEKQGKHQAILKAKAMTGVQPIESKREPTKSREPKQNQTVNLNETFTKLEASAKKSVRAKQYLEIRNIWSKSLAVGYNHQSYKDLKHCVIFPLKNKEGDVVSLYGRSIKDNDLSLIHI